MPIDIAARENRNDKSIEQNIYRKESIDMDRDRESNIVRVSIKKRFRRPCNQRNQYQKSGSNCIQDSKSKYPIQEVEINDQVQRQSHNDESTRNTEQSALSGSQSKRKKKKSTHLRYHEPIYDDIWNPLDAYPRNRLWSLRQSGLATCRPSSSNMRRYKKGVATYAISFFPWNMAPNSYYSCPEAAIQWVPDTASANCQICESAFNITHRRHHCRLCGHLVCKDCSLNRTIFPPSAPLQPHSRHKQRHSHMIKMGEPQRTCSSCSDILQQMATQKDKRVKRLDAYPRCPSRIARSQEQGTDTQVCGALREAQIIVSARKHSREQSVQIYHAIHSAWLEKWLRYVEHQVKNPESSPSSSNIKRPGPISNYALLDFKSGQLHLKTDLVRSEGNDTSGDYHVVGAHVWKAFSAMYGGGPRISLPPKRTTISMKEAVELARTRNESWMITPADEEENTREWNRIMMAVATATGANKETTNESSTTDPAQLNRNASPMPTFSSFRACEQMRNSRSKSVSKEEPKGFLKRTFSKTFKSKSAPLLESATNNASKSSQSLLSEIRHDVESYFFTYSTQSLDNDTRTRSIHAPTSSQRSISWRESGTQDVGEYKTSHSKQQQPQQKYHSIKSSKQDEVTNSHNLATKCRQQAPNRNVSSGDPSKSIRRHNNSSNSENLSKHARHKPDNLERSIILQIAPHKKAKSRQAPEVQSNGVFRHKKEKLTQPYVYNSADIHRNETALNTVSALAIAAVENLHKNALDSAQRSVITKSRNQVLAG